MEITVVCYGALREHLPAGAAGNRAALDMAEGATVSDVISALGAGGGMVYAILVNGDQADATQALAPGDEVTLMPPFAGG